MLSISANATLCLWDINEKVIIETINVPIIGFRFQNICIKTNKNLPYQVIVYGSINSTPIIINTKKKTTKCIDINKHLNGSIVSEKLNKCDYLIDFSSPNGNILHVTTSMSHLIAFQVFYDDLKDEFFKL